MTENWHSLVYFLVEKFCFINRQIDAAVATGILVDGSAEFTSPACVMETDAAVEWHPIIYVTFIFICAVCPFGAAQNAVGLLVGQAVNTFRGCVVLDTFPVTHGASQVRAPFSYIYTCWAPKSTSA